MLIVRTPNGAGGVGSPITTVAASVGVFVGDMLRSEGYSCAITGITTGSVDIESTIDGTTWVKEGSSITADGRVNVTSMNLQAIRANVKTATAVAVLFTVAGRRDADPST
jgi:hypothetical protein